MITTEDIAIKLNTHDHAISNLEVRLDKAENTIEEIRNLTTSVQLMAQKQEMVIEKVDTLNTKVDALDNAPKDTWNKIKMAVISSCVTAVVAALVAAVIALL